MAEKSTTLLSPEGEAYQTSDRSEIVRLKARGYTEEKLAKKAATSSKSD